MAILHLTWKTAVGVAGMAWRLCYGEGMGYFDVGNGRFSHIFNLHHCNLGGNGRWRLCYGEGTGYFNWKTAVFPIFLISIIATCVETAVGVYATVMVRVVLIGKRPFFSIFNLTIATCVETAVGV